MEKFSEVSVGRADCRSESFKTVTTTTEMWWRVRGTEGGRSFSMCNCSIFCLIVCWINCQFPHYCCLVLQRHVVGHFSVIWWVKDLFSCQNAKTIRPPAHLCCGSGGASELSLWSLQLSNSFWICLKDHCIIFKDFLTCRPAVLLVVYFTCFHSNTNQMSISQFLCGISVMGPLSSTQRQPEVSMCKWLCSTWVTQVWALLSLHVKMNHRSQEEIHFQISYVYFWSLFRYV